MSTKGIGEVIEHISNSTSVQIIQFLMNREYPSRFKEILQDSAV
jgi:DNA-binding HxlR family transcriptional regulator